MIVPRLKHDCAECRPIDADHLGEWYFCPPTAAIVCRFGSKPSEYWGMALDTLKTTDPLVIGTAKLRKVLKLYVVLSAALEESEPTKAKLLAALESLTGWVHDAFEGEESGPSPEDWEPVYSVLDAAAAKGKA